MDSKENPKNIDEYIGMFSKNVQSKLESLRLTILKFAPKAEETISYQTPTFKLNGTLVHFAAYKNHIGFYPTPSGIGAFKDELCRYKNSKGGLQFPIEEKLPLGLITKIVKFRVKESQAKKRKVHE